MPPPTGPQATSSVTAFVPPLTTVPSALRSCTDTVPRFAYAFAATGSTLNASWVPATVTFEPDVVLRLTTTLLPAASASQSRTVATAPNDPPVVKKAVVVELAPLPSGSTIFDTSP